MATAAMILLTACGNSNDSGTSPPSAAPTSSTAAQAKQSPSWSGTFTGPMPQATQVAIGTWEGNATAVKLDCARHTAATVKVTMTAPGGFTATSTQPAGGGPATITLTGPDHAVTWDSTGKPSTVQDYDPSGQNSNTPATWGATPTLATAKNDISNEDHSLKEGTQPGQDTGYRFDLKEAVVDCTER